MRTSWVAAVCCAAQVASGLLAASAARAEGEALNASVICAPASAPGRILCDLVVRARAASGKLVWADALVVSAPPFARPLRSRILAHSDAPGAASAKLALVASEVGQGELRLRVRAVLCHEGSSGQSCSPEVVAVTAAVAVTQGSPQKP